MVGRSLIVGALMALVASTTVTSASGADQFLDYNTPESTLAANAAGAYSTVDSFGATTTVDAGGDFLAAAGTTDTSAMTASFAASAPASKVTSPTVTDTACVNAYKAAGLTPKACTITTESAVSAKAASTVGDAAMIYQQEIASGATAAEATTASKTPATCRSWHQTSWGGIGGTWIEKHIGKYCYAGRNVWVWRFPGRTAGGYHYCDEGFQVGYTLEIRHCNILRVNDSHFYGGYFRQNWDRFKIHVLAGAIPIAFSHDMHANVFPSGNLTFHK